MEGTRGLMEVIKEGYSFSGGVGFSGYVAFLCWLCYVIKKMVQKI